LVFYRLSATSGRGVCSPHAFVRMPRPGLAVLFVWIPCLFVQILHQNGSVWPGLVYTFCLDAVLVSVLFVWKRSLQLRFSLWRLLTSAASFRGER
jgi:hypothetical protein